PALGPRVECYNLRVLQQFLLRAPRTSSSAPAHIGEWLSLVEHLVRDQGVGGSNPLSPTIIYKHCHKFANRLHQRVVTRFKKEEIRGERQTVWKQGCLNLLPTS